MEKKKILKKRPKMEKKKDSLENIKYIGYCISQLPPKEATLEWDDFIEYVKFQLCRINKRLMKDPIWDEYREEELLVEYYAHLYHNSAEERNKFINALGGIDEDIYSWLDSQVTKNQEEMNNSKKDNINFSQESLGD